MTLALSFGEVFSIVVGVVLALAGLALLLMGLTAFSVIAITTGISLLVLALGLWLIGLFG